MNQSRLSKHVKDQKERPHPGRKKSNMATVTKGKTDVEKFKYKEWQEWQGFFPHPSIISNNVRAAHFCLPIHSIPTKNSVYKL